MEWSETPSMGWSHRLSHDFMAAWRGSGWGLLREGRKGRAAVDGPPWEYSQDCNVARAGRRGDRMRRREFLIVSAMLASGTQHAFSQQVGPKKRLAFVHSSTKAAEMRTL